MLQSEHTLTMLSDSHGNITVVSGDIRGKGHLAEASSVQCGVLQRDILMFTHRLV
jgi:hypothetical protein